MSEQLHDCPKCGTKNFTAKGLATHNCAKHAARRDASLAVATPKALAAENAAMGEQLTAQYQKAINAMPEVLKFGAMVIELEAKLVHDGPVSGGSGKRGGLREWLSKHAPEVPRANALRFRDVVLGIATQYEELVGRKVAKQFALPALVSADPAKLAPAVRKKREALFGYVSGTSQKSWLDQIRPPKDRGGAQGKGKAKKLTPAEEEAAFHAANRVDFTTVFTGLDTLVLNGHWMDPEIKDGELDSAVACAEKFAAQAKAWLKLPQKKRTRPALNDAVEAAEEPATSH